MYLHPRSVQHVLLQSPVVVVGIELLQPHRVRPLLEFVFFPSTCRPLLESCSSFSFLRARKALTARFLIFWACMCIVGICVALHHHSSLQPRLFFPRRNQARVLSLSRCVFVVYSYCVSTRRLSFLFLGVISVFSLISFLSLLLWFPCDNPLRHVSLSLPSTVKSILPLPPFTGERLPFFLSTRG